MLLLTDFTLGAGKACWTLAYELTGVNGFFTHPSVITLRYKTFCKTQEEKQQFALRHCVLLYPLDCY